MSDLVDRLRGKYRIPITDGLGAAGGDEPENELEFVRTFPSPPIQVEAADEIERLRTILIEVIPFIGYQAHVPEILERAEKAVHYGEQE